MRYEQIDLNPNRADELLEDLLRACARSNFSRGEIKRTLVDVLVWHTKNNTDANCRKVDLFVSMKMDGTFMDRLPKDIRDILFDMGGALHDTHTSPTVAGNFMSTPQQLLYRVGNLPE